MLHFLQKFFKIGRNLFFCDEVNILNDKTVYIGIYYLQ